MVLIFNELSIHQIFVNENNHHATQESVCKFVEFLRLLTSKNILKKFRVSYEIASLKLPKTMDIELKRYYYRVLVDKHFHYIAKDDIENQFLFTVDNKEYSGIGLAFACNVEGSVLSVLTHEFWREAFIKGKHIYLTCDGDTSSIDSEICNYSHESDIKKLEALARQEIQSDISSGQDLWEKRESLFPNLIFCDSVKAQLYQDPEKFHIMQIIEKLTHLQNYFSSFSGRYDPMELGLSARTESDTVKSDPKLKRQRLFSKPDGTSAYFYDHIGFNGNFANGRIHFLPHATENKCYIGYIGRHLSTKKY